MPARTGKEFLQGLKDDRQIWVGSEPPMRCRHCQGKNLKDLTFSGECMRERRLHQ
jgi:hypothetical protein